jgi:hypothetical protein
MNEATGFEAKTIHRLLEADPQGGGFKRGAHGLTYIRSAGCKHDNRSRQLQSAISTACGTWQKAD